LLLETFGTLLRDPAHWYFELMLIVIFDGVLGMLVWPFIDRHLHSGDEGEHMHVEALEDVVTGLVERIRVLEGKGKPGSCVVCTECVQCTRDCCNDCSDDAGCECSESSKCCEVTYAE
jgi:hypothetical protein